MRPVACFFLVLATSLGLGCEARLALGSGCTRSSECEVGLVCGVGGRCREECNTSRDCTLGARCLRDPATGANGCSLPTIDGCTTAAPCTDGLRCLDGECVNVCVAAADCPDGRCVDGSCEVVTDPVDGGEADAGAGDAGPDCKTLPGTGEMIVDVAMGQQSTCAVTAADAVYCWGFWEARATSGAARAIPYRVLADDGAPLAARDVAVGGFFGCAILPDTSVACWGDYAGAPGATERAFPLLRESDGLPLTGATAITAGYVHACALVGGEAWCWGVGAYGVLGTGTEDDHFRAVPAAELGTGLAGIAAGQFDTLAFSGTAPSYALVGVGLDSDGRLGGTVPTPDPGALTAVHSSITDFDLLATAGSGTCILRAEAPWCWGQLYLFGTEAPTLDACGGYCTTTPQAINVELSAPLVGLAADTAGDAAIGWTTAGRVYGWGANRAWVLDPDLTVSGLPTARLLPGFTGSTHRVEMNGGAACAIVDGSGELWCWGDNTSGHLGRETMDTNDQAVAASVCWPPS